jgi:hypothetical protein
MNSTQNNLQTYTDNTTGNGWFHTDWFWATLDSEVVLSV